MTTAIQIPSRRRVSLLFPLAFTTLVLACVALFLIPAWIIQPFRYQSPQALALALTVRRVSPAATLLCAIVALFLAVRLWNHLSQWKKGLLVLGLIFAATATVMARVDYFEWMFHPIAAPGFDPAQNAQLDSAEMVMAVRFGNDARAYPIRAMAYHHVVNDVVNGVPITVTY